MTSKSPDLNPIENLWGIIDTKVKAAGPKTKKRLIKFVKRQWENMDMDFVKNLINFVPTRLREVIARHGEMVDC